jgi:hypothetical protein
MSYEIEDANTEDVLRALARVQESVAVWKAIIEGIQASGQSVVNIAMGPFPMLRILGPPPPFSGCEGEFLMAKPQTGCVAFDIDTYVGQISGLFKGIYHGLEQGESDPANP